MSSAKAEIVPRIRDGAIPFIQYRDGTLRLDGSKRREIAYFLRDQGGFTELQIEATVSRFAGFSETQPPSEEVLNPI